MDNQELYILNDTNKWITEDVIENILSNFGISHKVADIEPYRQSLIHVSYLKPNDNITNDSGISNRKFKKKTQNNKAPLTPMEPIKDPTKAIPLQQQSYERMEFLGDSVLHLILAEYLFMRYEEQDEGFMTRLRTKIENGNILARMTKIIGLNKYVIVSRSIELCGGRHNNDKILEDVFESFIAALYQDAGFDVCREFFTKLIEQEIDFAEILRTETNFKDVLLRYFHQMRWSDPIYGTMEQSGPDNKRSFTMYVQCKKNKTDEGDIVGVGKGMSKKEGEQNAARQALIHFGQIEE